VSAGRCQDQLADIEHEIETTGKGPMRPEFSEPVQTTRSQAQTNVSISTLLYDSNGSDAGGTQVALAHLENGGPVDAAHIHMV